MMTPLNPLLTAQSVQDETVCLQHETQNSCPVVTHSHSFRPSTGQGDSSTCTRGLLLYPLRNCSILSSTTIAIRALVACRVPPISMSPSSALVLVVLVGQMSVVAQRACRACKLTPSLDQGRWFGAMLLCVSVHNGYTQSLAADIPLLQWVVLPIALLAVPGYRLLAKLKASTVRADLGRIIS